MAPLALKVDAERRMRDLLESEGLPQPDAVEYGYECIRLFFNDKRLVVIVELNE